MAFGQLASAAEDATYHIPDERGANEPFHPISVCGQVLTRDLVEETPKDATVCKNCSGTTGKSVEKAKSDEPV